MLGLNTRLLTPLLRGTAPLRPLPEPRMCASASFATDALAEPPPAPQACYVHIPFCRRRCHYCDFPIQVVGDRESAADAASEAYLQLLLREIRASPSCADGDGAEGGRPLRSVYFGGGTPSLMPPRLLARLLDALRERHGFAADLECTLEMDPGTFDAERLSAFLAAGVTRVSLGVQSFDDALLRACGRSHDLADAERAIALLTSDAAASAGLTDVSVDLIGGLPHQSLAAWRTSLEAAAASGAQHVSVYDLQVEDGTAFGSWYSEGVSPLPEEGVAAQMFREASAVLGARGFERYEVSSFARPGHRCRHNRAYWRNEPFWGFGLGATSHVGGRRLARPRRMDGYARWVDELEARGWAAQQAAGAGEAESALDELQTRLMLALRTDAGVSARELRAAYPGALGAAAADACADTAREVPAAWLAPPRDGDAGDGDAGDVLRLSDPEGLLFSNDAISTCFARLEERLEARRWKQVEVEVEVEV